MTNPSAVAPVEVTFTIARPDPAGTPARPATCTAAVDSGAASAPAGAPTPLRVSSRRLGRRATPSLLRTEPMRSTSTWVSTLLTTQSAPSDDSDTTTAFATVAPEATFTFEVVGTDWSQGYAVRKPFAAAFTAVRLMMADAASLTTPTRALIGTRNTSPTARGRAAAVPRADRVSTMRCGVSGTMGDEPSNQADTSASTSVGTDALRQTLPPEPRPTSTAFAMVTPARKFRFDVVGWVPPQGHTVRNPSPPGPTAVTFNAAAVAPGTTPARPATTSCKTSPTANRE